MSVANTVGTAIIQSLFGSRDRCALNAERKSRISRILAITNPGTISHVRTLVQEYPLGSTLNLDKVEHGSEQGDRSYFQAVFSSASLQNWLYHLFQVILLGRIFRLREI